ncbi:MAG: hypothetical protein NXI16_18310 [Alphaproteobacteria bacterium]|nr:hypothetical protein [Alphaproteobacteria bacterium]
MSLSPSNFNAQRYYLSDPERLKKAILRACLSDEARADAIYMSNVKPINLETVKAHFGAHWQKVSARVMALIEESVQAHIDDGDFFVLLGDGRIAVIFGAKDPIRIQQQTARIAAQVNQTIKNSSVLKGVTVGATAVGLSEEQALKAGDAPETLRKVLDTTQARQEKAEAAAAKAVEETGRARFWPVFEFARKRVPLYLAELDPSSVGSGPQSDLGGRYGLDVDQFVIKTASHALVRGASDADLIVPVGYFSVVKEEHFQKLLDMLRVLPDQDRRRLTAMVTGLDPEADKELLESLPTRFREVGVETALEVDAKTAGLMAKTAHLDLRLVACRSDTAGVAAEDIDAVLERCQRYEVPTFASRVRRVGDSRDAKKRGFHFAAGPGVAPALQTIGETLIVED